MMVAKAPSAVVCETCLLYDGCLTPCMPGSGSEKPLILLVGESPGEQEDKQGIPFVGQSGQLLRHALEVAGADINGCRFTNTVRCRPPHNRTPTPKEISNCSEFLVQEILTYDPTVIVLLGNTPLKAVLGETGITTWNGVVVERDGITYIPAFHPPFLLRSGMQEDIMQEWVAALVLAVIASQNGSVPKAVAKSQYEYHYPYTIQDIDAMRDAVLAFDGSVAYDVETRWLGEKTPGNTILSCSLATDTHVWSFALDHSEAQWSDNEYVYVVGVLRDILTSVRVLGHNVRFDSQMTRGLLGIDVVPCEDTMRMSQLVDSKPGIHGLKRLAGLHVNMYDYDKELRDYLLLHMDADPGRGGDFALVPLELLLPYGAKDAVATYLLHLKLCPLMTPRQKILYEQLIMRVDYTLGLMESAGFLLDTRLARRYWALYHLAAQRYYDEMMKDKQVKKFMVDRQTKTPKFRFNPNSTDQMAEVFYVYKKHKITDRTATGKASVGIDNLKLNTVANDVMFEQYRRWKLMTSMESKYLGPAISGKWEDGDDGRVRANFNIGGAKTGRLSSSNPNLQNIPTPEKEPGTLLAQLPIKNIFTHTWEGGCLAMFDFSGMELRVMASMSNCKGMIDAFKQGRDIHTHVTNMVFGVPYDEVTKELRYKAKWASWTIAYAGSAKTLHQIYNLPMSEAEFIFKSYLDQFPEILDYQERIAAFATSHRYVESAFGRRLYLPYINDRDKGKAAAERRSGINMPIQSLASDILLCALVVIYHYRREYGWRSMFVNTVHDSLVCDIFPGELEDVVCVCKDIMENIPTYAIEFFPGLDFSWLKVPLLVDVECGSHYGTLEEYHIPKEGI